MKNQINLAVSRRIMSAKEKFAALALISCLAFNLICVSLAQAADIHRETIPLERNGVTLNLERYMEQDGKTKQPVLFVHGLTYSSHEFDVDYKDYSLARYLAKHGFEVWLLDIAGYGKSGSVKDGFMPNSDYAAEDIHAAIDKICEVSKQDQIDILGWSWGTVTAGRCVAKYPEHVGKLILYAPILSGIGEYEVTEPFHHNTWEHAADDFQRTEEGTFDDSITDPVVIEMLCSGSWHYDGELSPNGGRRDICVDRSNKLIALENISVPTLIICGDKDPYLNYDLVNTAVELLPEGSSLEVIKGASHVAFIEKPYYKDFRSRLIGFLDGEEPDAPEAEKM